MKARPDGTIEMADGKPLKADHKLTAQEVVELINLVAPQAVKVPQVVFGRGGGNMISRVTDLTDFFPSYAGRALETLKVDRNGAAITTAPENVNVKLFGATGDGVTNDQPAIQTAIDRLPAAGGIVFLPPGTYRINSTLTLPDKDILILGAGLATIIDLGANAIAAFTVPTGLTVVRRYDVAHLYIRGSNVVGQETFRLADANGRGDIWFSYAQASDIETYVNWTAYNTNYDRQSVVHAFGSSIFPSSLSTATLAKTPNPAGSYFAPVAVRFDECIAFRLSSATEGTRAWTANADCDFWFVNSSVISVRPGSFKVNGFSTFYSEIRAIGATGDYESFGNGWDGFDYCIGTFFTGINAAGAATLAHRLVIRGTQFQLSSSRFGEGRLLIEATAARAGLSNSTFRNSTFAGVALEVKGSECRITGSTFPGALASLLQLTDVTGVVVSGCSFSPTGSINTIAESGTATNNRIDGCVGLNLGSGLSLLGPTTRVDGVQPGNAIGVMEGVAKANANVTAVGNVGTGEDDLITYSLPALSLLKVGSAVRIRAWGTTANNANAKTLRLYFGVAVLTTSLTVSQAGFWEINAIVVKNGASTQDANASLIEFPGTLHDIEQSAPNQTDTAAITIKCTGDATASNDIVQEGLLVEVLN